MVKIEGYKETVATLVQLSDQMQKRIVLSALRAATKPMLLQARQNVPSRSGTLKKKLGIVTARKGNQPHEKSILLKHVFARNKRKGNINEYYGQFVHEGTSDMRVTRKNSKTMNLKNYKNRDGKVRVQSTSREGGTMVFTGKDGKKVFAQRTKGLKPNPYLERAYESQVATVEQRFGDELEKALNKFLDKNFKEIR